MPGDFNYYTLLGVTPKATSAEIKSAYRSAVAKYHPDVNQAPNAENLTAILNEAWSVFQDPVKKADYDAKLDAERSGKLGTVKKEANAPTVAMLHCERCGEEDVHQRFVIFHRVMSTLFFSYITTTALRLCTKCRSKEACSSALYTAFLGFWAIPWGVLNSVKALYIAIKGGSMDKRSSASMLGYLANAYAQRGENDAAATTLAACYRFQRSKGIADALTSFKNVGAKVMEEPHRLDGQIYASASFDHSRYFIHRHLYDISSFVAALVGGASCRYQSPHRERATFHQAYAGFERVSFLTGAASYP